MKKYRNYLFLILILLAVAVYFFVTDRPGTLKKDPQSFALKDTSGVSEIVFIHRDDSLIFQRNDAGWQINGMYPANNEAVKMLLETLSSLEISSPVPGDYYRAVMNSFDLHATEVMVVSGNKAVLHFRVAENDSLHLGSFVMEYGDTDPYVVRIPGYNGHLSSLFRIIPGMWRDKTAFRYPVYDILSVSVSYPENIKASFTMDISNPASVKLTRGDGTGSRIISKEITEQYLSAFASVPFETFDREKSMAVYDSVSRVPPFCVIKVQNIENKVNIVKTYQIPLSGQSQKFNLFTMYAVIQNDSVANIVKYVDFDPIMKEYGDFAHP